MTAAGIAILAYGASLVALSDGDTLVARMGTVIILAGAALAGVSWGIGW